MSIMQFLSSRAGFGDRETPSLIAVIGPTAVGKTSVAIELALELGAEVISADSRQVFREMTIGTAKPSPSDLKQVPHHFINEKSITERFTAAEYGREAEKRIRDIHSRGRHALLVGGSTLYIHALLFGLDDVPPTDPEIRKGLKARLKSDGLASLVEELKEIDSQTADRIDLQNSRRVLRALEVYYGAGKPISKFQDFETFDLRPRTFDLLVLTRPRNILYERINSRVDAMLEEGLIDEVRQILEVGHSPTLQALQTIGYREVVMHLSGEVDRNEMVALIKRNTRRYAKRQLTWFRRYKEARWIDLSELRQ